MTLLNEQAPFQNHRILVAAESGAGKTALLASLANAGWQLKIQDFDGGLEILRYRVKPACKKNVSLETYVDKKMQVEKKTNSGTMLVTVPSTTNNAFGESETDRKQKWPDGGCIFDWGPECIYVLDSYSFWFESAIFHIMRINGWGRYESMGQAVGFAQQFLDDLKSPRIKCQILVMFHLQTSPDKFTDELCLFPASIGRDLPYKVGRFFNTALSIETAGEKKTLITRPTRKLPWIKTAMPIPPEGFEMAKEGKPPHEYFVGGLASYLEVAYKSLGQDNPARIK